MAHQTQVNGSRTNGGRTSESAGESVREDVAHFAGDLVALAELQCQLLAHDLREAASRSALSLAFLAGGAAFGFAALPVALLAFGFGPCIVWVS